MAKISIEIQLGNDAMQTMEDVLRSVKEDFQGYADWREPLTVGDSGRLRDENGNTVGRWEVTE